MRVPFFIEAWESSEMCNLQICRRVMCTLFRNRIAPLPFASTSRDVAQVSATLRSRGLNPAVFIVNTYLAEPLLDDLDKTMGDTPVLLLRRQIHAHHLTRKRDLLDTTVILKRMNGRQTMLCLYNPDNATMVSDQVADCLLKFLKDGDFWHFARLSVLSISSSDL